MIDVAIRIRIVAEMKRKMIWVGIVLPLKLRTSIVATTRKRMMLVVRYMPLLLILERS